MSNKLNAKEIQKRIGTIEETPKEENELSKTDKIIPTIVTLIMTMIAIVILVNLLSIGGE